MTVRGYLNENEIHMKFSTLPVVLFEGMRTKGWGWFLLDKEYTLTKEVQWVVISSVFEDEV